MKKTYQEEMKDKDADRVYQVMKKLKIAIIKAEAGKIPFAAVFNNIPLRDCLPQYTILATTWHIEDIRPKFSAGISDHELFQKLLELEKTLNTIAVENGNEWLDIV
jgi:hypothetical protein